MYVCMYNNNNNNNNKYMFNNNNNNNNWIFPVSFIETIQAIREIIV